MPLKEPQIILREISFLTSLELSRKCLEFTVKNALKKPRKLEKVLKRTFVGLSTQENIAKISLKEFVRSSNRPLMKDLKIISTSQKNNNYSQSNNKLIQSYQQIH